MSPWRRMRCDYIFAVRQKHFSSYFVAAFAQTPLICRCLCRSYYKSCGAYGADLFTPHLPQAASSPQAPQGEDNWVRCKIKHRTFVTRNVTVSTIVPNRATRDICIRSCPNAPLKKQKRRCPTGERQRLFCDFVAAYCGLRSSAIPVTSKEKRDGKKNQTNNVLLFI